MLLNVWAYITRKIKDLVKKNKGLLTMAYRIKPKSHVFISATEDLSITLARALTPG